MQYNLYCREHRGFFELYAIGEWSSNDEENRHRGLVSPFGRRGSICSHLHWTWDYLHHGISWAIVQRLLIDAPSYDFDSDKKNKVIKLTDDNVDEVYDFLNSI